MVTSGKFRAYAAGVVLLTSVSAASARYSGGTGEPNDPYQIATAADLIALGASPADYGRQFVLTTDIDLDPNLPGRKVFDKAVIAPDTDPADDFQGASFTGVFDGKGHTIRNLKVIGGAYLGLFGSLAASAGVTSLGLEAIEVRGTGGHVGGLAGYSEARIAGNSSSGAVSGKERVGGLVGSNYARVATSSSSASVSGTDEVGGLVGHNWGGVDSSSSSGAVRATGRSAGGLVGLNDNASITVSCSTGPVSGNQSVGGLVGSHRQGSIGASYSSGSVSGKDNIGGLVGENPADGYGEAGAVHASFWDVQTSGRTTSAGGTGKTTAEMQNRATFLRAGWDFVEEVANGTCDYWQATPSDYPRLQYQRGTRPVMPEGLGTAEQPYLIRNARDLGTVWFEPRAHYRLAQSLDLSGMTWSTAVVLGFDGSFDGSGYAIRNVHIQGGRYVGFFGILGDTARISDLDLHAVEVSGTNSVGGLAGANFGGTIVASSSSGSVSGTGSLVGGLVGDNWGRIDICYSSSSVSSTAYYYLGGLAGANAGSITGSYSDGSVSGNGWVGGFVGWNCWGGSIANSYSSAGVSGTNYYVGGLAGVNEGYIATSYSSGLVTSTSSVLGGLVGRSFGGSGIWFVGGIVFSSFWDVQTSGQTASVAGTGKTTAQMQTAKTFLDAGWDFVGETKNGTKDLWWIDEGKDYPRLWWELPATK
jgi:hypothetical protein